MREFWFGFTWVLLMSLGVFALVGGILTAADWLAWFGIVYFALVFGYAALLPARRRRQRSRDALARRVGALIQQPPIVDMDYRQRMEFKAALLKAWAFEDLPPKFQTAILEAEGNQPPDWGVLTGESPRQAPEGQVAKRS